MASCNNFIIDISTDTIISEDGIFTYSPSNSRPVSLIKDGNEKILVGYYSSDNTIRISLVEPETHATVKTKILFKEWGWNASGTKIGDDHANPSIVVLQYQKNEKENGKVVVVAAEHGAPLEGKGRLYIVRSARPLQIEDWDPEIPIVESYATYPRLIEVSNGELFLFCRLSGRKAPNSRTSFALWISQDGGRNWSNPVFIVDSGSQSDDTVYSFFHYDSFSDRIHIVFNRLAYDDPTEGVWRYQDIYYAYFDVKTNTWCTIDGSTHTLPLMLDKMEPLYRTDDTEGKEDWTFVSDIVSDSDGDPVIVSLESIDRGSEVPGNIGQNTIVQYHELSSSGWKTTKIANSDSFWYPSMAAIDPYRPTDVLFFEGGLDTGSSLVIASRINDNYWFKKNLYSDNLYKLARPFVITQKNGYRHVFFNRIEKYSGSPYIDWMSKIISISYTIQSNN